MSRRDKWKSTGWDLKRYAETHDFWRSALTKCLTKRNEDGMSATKVFYKEPVTRANVGCLNCGAPPTILPPKSILAVGFGMVAVTRDGECMWSGDDETMTSYRWTRWAKKQPERDWQIEFLGPLHKETYQYQDGQWVMIATGMGFA